MNLTNKQKLQDFRVSMLNSYEKVTIKHQDVVVLHLNDEKSQERTIIEYTREINPLRSKSLSKWDYINLKRYAKYNSYWIDKDFKTISIKGDKYKILKVKGNIYFRNEKTGALKNATKLFSVSKKLNSVKAAEFIMDTLIKHQAVREQFRIDNHNKIIANA